MPQRVYLDHAATTPLWPEVAACYEEHHRQFFANPASLHREGRVARAVVDEARQQVGALLGADATEVVFCASASEANNLAVKGALLPGGGGLACTAVEHSSVLEPGRWLHDRLGRPFFTLPVDSEGRLVLPAMEALLSGPDAPGVGLVSVQWVNNEVGAVQDVEAVAALCHGCGVAFHCDAVQGAGVMDLSQLGRWPVALASLSAHKFHGPKGVGIALVRGVKPDSLIHGGGQEMGLRAGTENPAAIAAAALALRLTQERREATRQHLAILGEHLWGLLAQKAPGLRLHGPALGGPHRLPGHLSVGVPGVSGEGLVINLDLEGVAASSGSACASGSLRPSHVLLAMGLSQQESLGALRLTLGPDTTLQDVAAAASAFGRVVARLEGGT